MAYKTLPPPVYPGSELHAFYNVSMAVGQGKPNNPDDVMLVQLCLQQVYSWPSIFPLVPDVGAIKADGKCGPITVNAIWFFQTQLQESGVLVYPDGVIDRASDWRAGTTSGYGYSILWMNWSLKQVIGEERFLHLDVDRITPGLLSLKLGISDF